MFSPKAFVQDIIARNISDWVENIHEDSFQVSCYADHETYALTSIANGVAFLFDSLVC